MSKDIESKKAKLTELRASLDSDNAELTRKTETFKKELLDQQKKLVTNVETFSNNMLSKSEGATKEVTNLVGTLSDQQKAIDADLKKLKTDLNSILAKIKTSLSNTEAETKKILTGQLDGMKKQQAAFTFNAKDVFDEERKAVKGLQGQLEGVLTQIQSRLGNFVDREEENFKNSAATLESIGEELDEYQQQVGKIANDVGTGIETKFGQFTTAVEGDYEQSITSLKNSSDDLIKAMETTIAERKKELNDLKEEFTKQLSDLVTNSSTVQEGAQEKTAELLNNFSSKEADNFAAIMENASGSFKQELAIEHENIKKQVAQVRQDFRQNLYKELNNVVGGFTSFHDIFMEQINSVIATLQEKANEMQNTLDDLIKKRVGEIQGVTEQLESKLEELVANSAKNFTDQYSKIKTNFDAELNGKSAEFKKELDVFKTDILKVLDGANRETQTHVDSIGKSLRTAITTELTTTNAKTDELLKNFKDGTTKYVGEQSKLLNESGQKIVNDSNRSKDDLAAAVNGLEPAIEKVTTTYGAKIDGKRKEILSFLEQSSDEVRKEVDGLGRDALQEISQLNLSIEGKINDRADELHKKITEIVNTMIKSQETQFTTFMNGVTEKFSGTLEEIGEIEPEVVKTAEEKMTAYKQKTENLKTEAEKVKNESIINKNKAVEVVNDTKDEFKDKFDILNKETDAIVTKLRKQTEKVLKSTDEIIKVA